MRITNSMITDTILTNLNYNLKRLNKFQEQMSSGKTVSRPSDDPVYVSRIMRLQSMVQEQERYQTTMEDAQGFIDNSETCLGTVSDILNRARELAIYGANGNLTAEDRLTFASEVDELINETLEVANSNYEGRYIFGGYQTAAPPFERAGDVVTYVGDGGLMNWEVARGVTLTVNVPGDELFQNGVGNIFDALIGLKQALETNNAADLSGPVIGSLDSAVDHTLSQRAVLGARSNRLSIAQDRAFQNTINLTELLSRLEDVDWAEAVMNYETAVTVYEAALGTGAQVIQPTLLDYLR